MLFEKYRMSLNQDKYDIEVQNDDARKHNQVFFDFMQQKFNCLDRLYLHGQCLLIRTIFKILIKEEQCSGN